MDLHFHVDKVVLNEASVFAYLEQKGYNISILQKCNDNYLNVKK